MICHSCSILGNAINTIKTYPYPYTAFILLQSPSYGRFAFYCGGGSPPKCVWPQTPQHNLVLLLNSFRHRERFRLDTTSPKEYQSPIFGIWMRYLDISYVVVSHDMGYDITIYRDISCNITPDHPKPQGENTLEPTTLFRSTVCYWLLVFTLFLTCRSSELCCRLSVLHQLGTS